MKSSVLPSTKDIDDNNIAAPKATSGRIRNKIAKFADMATPLDVETLDLECLVKTHLAGKTLIRLFYGVQNNHVFTYSDRSTIDNNHSQNQNQTPNLVQNQTESIAILTVQVIFISKNVVVVVWVTIPMLVNMGLKV